MNRITIPGGWEFDPSTEFIYLDGVIQSGSEYEPIYLNTSGGPVFTGIYKKMTDQIILLNGQEVKNIDSEYLIL